MYATRAGTLSMMSLSSDSEARSASCACFSPWMSFISTNAPGTSPDGAESGTTRIVIHRDSPLAPGIRRSNSADSPSSARAIFACALSKICDPITSRRRSVATSSAATPKYCSSARLTYWQRSARSM